MKLLYPLPVVLLVAIAFLACRQSLQYPYAIRDFDRAYQQHLTDVVTSNLLDPDNDVPGPGEYIYKNMPIPELRMLSRCEHPVLRSLALSALMERDSNNRQQIILEHLDDTALFIDFQGIVQTVSDEMLWHAHWDDPGERTEVLDKVIREHNYLRSAYVALNFMKIEDAYYPFIKTMALRDRWKNDRWEDAFYALAAFKKPEDKTFIRETLLKEYHRLTERSFRLMKDFPDTAYHEVLRQYFLRGLRSQVCKREAYDNPRHFFEAVASYKNEWSASILKQALNGLPQITCHLDTSGFNTTVKDAIWTNRCPAYSKLTKTIEAEMLDRDRNNAELQKWWAQQPREEVVIEGGPRKYGLISPPPDK